MCEGVKGGLKWAFRGLGSAARLVMDAGNRTNSKGVIEWPKKSRFSTVRRRRMWPFTSATTSASPE
jgi:hypothetical protein